MDIPSDVAELAKVFENFGASDPQGWAKSQLTEGIPQLQRFLFLRQAWRGVIGEGDVSWIQSQIDEADRYADGPYAGVGAALKRALAKGVSPQDLTDMARGMQVQMLFRLCYLLDDPSFSEPALHDLAWGLFEVDDDDNPIPPRIGGLHESVLETDPTGREMRPRHNDV